MNLFTSTFFNSGDSDEPVVDNYPDATIVEVDTNFGDAGFSLIQNNYDMITIDWGDGRIQETEGTFPDNGFSHDYEESKKYIIKIQGNSIEQVKFNYFPDSVISAIKCGSSLTSHEEMFSRCPNLSKVEKTFKIGSNSNSQAWMFYYCSSLSEITHNLFPDNGITLFAPDMFAYSGLTKVKKLIIPGEVEGHELQGMFTSCNLYSFDFNSFFKYNDWTYANGTGMFQNNISWEAEIPGQYFWESSHWIEYSVMFDGCYSLVNFGDIPIDWK